MAFITNCWTLDILICVFCVIITVYIYVKKSHSYWKNRGVKSVPSPNIFGNFYDCLFVKTSLRDFFQDVYSIGNGEKFIGFYVFDKPFLILRDPETIKNVLVKDFKNFANRCMAPTHSDYIGSVNIFSVKNPAWKILRQHLSPVFTSSKLKPMLDLIVETGADLNTHLENVIINDEWNVLDIKDLCEMFTTDVIGSTMFGLKLNALNNPNAEFRSEGKKHFQNSYGRYISLLSLFMMPRLAKLLGLTFFDEDVSNFFKRVIPEAMDARLKHNIKRNDLLDAFMEMNETYKDEKNEFHYYFQTNGLVATAIVFFLGGFEPSASIMYLVLYELAKQPEIQNKLRKEILDALEQTEGKITYEMVMNLPYLDMVTSEGLRKYPLLHFIDREAEHDYTFPDTNVTIEKGTPIIIPMSAIHMDPQNFSDPDVFDPQRFSPENKRKIAPFTYLPFGEGPRNCIGMRIGLAQTKIGLMQILSKYEVTPCKETPIPLEYDTCTVFTKSKHNMKLNVRRVARNMYN